jgi:hypothetical protein
MLAGCNTSGDSRAHSEDRYPQRQWVGRGTPRCRPAWINTTAVPQGGIGTRYMPMTEWLDENCRIRGWSITPAGPDWLHEIKLDGYRMHARLEAGRVKIITRRGNDWTDKYPTVARALASLPAETAYLDGELCGVLPDGRTAYNLIQNALEHGDALPTMAISRSQSAACLDRVG